MIAPLEALRSFCATLWRSRKSQSRVRFEAWQTRALERWLSRHLPGVDFYDRPPNMLSDLPITDKATVMGQFHRFNTAALDVAAAWNIQKSGGRSGELTIGASTGTSGNRGLFVVSEIEKMRWLGTIVAKTMADLIWKPQRVAIVLPQDTGLYASANSLSFIQLRTFSTQSAADTWRAEIEAFDPTVIVAPPKMLRLFAQENYGIKPVRVFSAAETLDPMDEQIATAFFGTSIRQIYMATEGLFAVSCAHGTLHLAEDSVAFEFEPVGDGLVSPLVTCFERETQIMARYRMNDVLRLSDAPCPCGSPLQAVTEVVGRMDDVFRFGDVQITPDVLRNAVLDADRSITDFRLVQSEDDTVLLKLPLSTTATTAEAACDGVRTLLDTFGAHTAMTVERAPLPLDPSRKLRRVERMARDG